MASSSSFTPSSSSPTNMKTTQFSRIQQTLSKKPNLSSSSKATSLIKRQETVFKKAYELSVLCGTEVCVICYGSDGKLKTWPEDREKVKDMSRRYNELSETKRRKKSVDLCVFLEKVNKEDAKQTNKDGSKKKKRKKLMFESKVKYSTWDPRFDNYSVEQLAKLIQSLEGSLTRIQGRFSDIVEAKGQRKIQNTNLANQELMMNTTMNHPHQQYSNQVSMYLYNHRTGTLSQVPVSASVLNQAQSLAPLPPGLRIYPNSNMGNYSGSLGVEETGIGGFQNMNMFNINGVNAFPKQIGQIPKVESYPGLLGVQDNGINGFGNINMDCYSNLDNNKVGDCLRLLGEEESGTNGLQKMNMNMYNTIYNANGLSHQLVQYPSQTTAPVFQFGSVQKQY